MGATGSITSSSQQYLDLESCKQITGSQFNEKLFEIFAVKVIPINILEQLINRPTIQDFQACKLMIIDIVKTKHCAPILVRIAWHDSLTYDDYIGQINWPRCGGANGSIRFQYDDPLNNGLNGALEILKPCKEKFPTISWADLLQLASATSIELSGGPIIPMRYGRIDAPQHTFYKPSERFPLPSGSWVDHLRDVFYRMGFTDKEIVVLSGAHTLGRARIERSGLGKPSTKYTTQGACPLGHGRTGMGSEGGTSWTVNWLEFDNSYFQNLLNPNPDEDLLLLDSDKALVQDSDFKKYVDIYATDQNTFFADYAEAHKRLSELGSIFVPEEGIVIS